MDVEEITDFKKLKPQTLITVTISKDREAKIKQLSNSDKDDLCAMAYFQGYRTLSDNTEARNGPVTRHWLQVRIFMCKI